VPTRSTRQHASVPTPCFRDRRTSAVGLSPLRPGALGSQTPTRRFAEAATGSGSVGCRRFRVGRTSTPPRASENHEDTAPPEHRSDPRWNESGGRSARTAPPACRPDRTNLPGDRSRREPPVRPPGGSFIRSDCAPSCRFDRSARPRESGWPRSTHVAPTRRTLSGLDQESLRVLHGLLLTGGLRTRVPGSPRRDPDVIDTGDLTVAVGVQPGPAHAVHPDRRFQPAIALSPHQCPGPKPRAAEPNATVSDGDETRNRGGDAGRLAQESPAPGHPLRAATGPGAGQIWTRAARPTRERTRAPSATRHHQNA
jgi:hypothetical protein